MRSARRRRTLAVVVTDGRGRPVRDTGLARWLSRAVPRARGQVSIALVSDARMRALNRTYRGMDQTTDVLSFKMEAGPSGPAHRPGLKPRPPRGSDRALGDLAISLPTARKQARVYGHSLSAELRILALHGLLHLLGYDHETDQGTMLRVEERLRRRAGLPVGLIARPVRRTRQP